jgi:8-oxo-dGTP diphosphatase
MASLANDAIIKVTAANEPSVALVRRFHKNNIYAISGGFVEIGETVRRRLRRTTEAKRRRTNLDISDPENFRVNSDPSRDLRRHTVSSVLRCSVASARGLHLGDDAKGTMNNQIGNFN